MMVVLSFVANAQKVKLVDGKLAFLKGQTEVNVVFTYNNLKIGKMTANDYVNKKVTDKNKHAAGSGDEWKTKWQKDLDTTFPSHFVKAFNIMLHKKGVTIQNDNNEAEYIFVINTSFVEPGYNVGISSKRATANMSVDVVDRANPKKVLAKFTITKSPGNSLFGTNYSSTDRIAGCYENAAERFANYFLGKKVF